MFNTDFDPNSVAERQEFTPLPAGYYSAQVIEATMGPTKNGRGERLSLQWDILEGDYQGRRVFQGINVVNENPKAQEIGQEELGEVCRAMGIDRIPRGAGPDIFQFIPCIIKVKLKRDDPTQNDVANVKPADGALPATGQRQAPAPARQAAPAATGQRQAPATNTRQAAPAGQRQAAGAMPWRK
jgi:hypothetical protein